MDPLLEHTQTNESIVLQQIESRKMVFLGFGISIFLALLVISVKLLAVVSLLLYFIPAFLIFLVLNSLALFAFGKYTDLKKGIKIGYLIAVILVIFPYFFILLNAGNTIFKFDQKNSDRAYTENDFTLCSRIKNQYSREECYVKIANTTSGDISTICSKITPTSANAQNCRAHQHKLNCKV
jgi:hypothetical protein